MQILGNYTCIAYSLFVTIDFLVAQTLRGTEIDQILEVEQQ